MKRTTCNWGFVVVAALCMGLASMAQALTTPLTTPVWVNTNYSSGGPNDGHIWGVDAFTNIQSGITAVATGGTVNVAAGGYTEALLITKSVTILGPQANVEPVAGGRPGGEATLTLTSVDHPLQIVADNMSPSTV